MSDSSDSETEISSKSKTKKETIFDNNIFDAEESDEKSKSINRKKKTNQQQSQSTKKSFVKTNNEQTKKEKVSKLNDEQSTGKKKITIPKTIEKKKVIVNSTKSTSKITKTTITTPGQKRPSTDESNESTKKFKIDDNKSKTPSIEEQISSTTNQTESEISTSNKPSIVITSAANEPSSNLPKIDQPSTETNLQTTPTKFGIVFTSHHRHSTTTPSSSIRTQSTETSKNDDEEMDEDNESRAVNNNNNKIITKNDQIPTNTLKPPNAGQTPLSDDETLNPETMQLSDLIGGNRREGTKSVQSRSATRTGGKGKRASKQDTSSSNKRQQTKANSKTISSTVSNEKESEPSVEQTPSIVTNAKRLSTTESSSISSPKNDKESKRLRKSTDDSAVQSQVKLEPVENLSQWTNTQVKKETIEPKLSSETNKKQIKDQSQVTFMETDQIPSSSSILTSTTSPETEHAIKAVYSNIQIPQPSVSKPSNLEKSSPIIASISKETLPIVEHKPTSIQTTSILPSHVSIKSSLTSATFSMFFDISYFLSFIFLSFCR
jgi:hypothetical protein